MNVWATEPPAGPYFDHRLHAWILSRYRDVAAALREPALAPVTALAPAPAVPIDGAVHADFRAHAIRALSPTAIEPWQAGFASAADLIAAELLTDCPVDLIERYAKPWSLQVAEIAAGVPSGSSERLSALARCVFDSACEPYDEALSAAAQTATVELSAFFQAAPPWTVQMFVALAHSLPAFLGNAWLALAEYPVEITDFSAAIDELLRFAGPAKAQFRQATAAVTLRDCSIQLHQRVILRLDIANRDPDGRASGHLAFGTGTHACVGATLVRAAAAAATKALLDRFRFAQHYVAVPVDCFAMRYVKSLQVTLLSR